MQKWRSFLPLFEAFWCQNFLHLLTNFSSIILSCNFQTPTSSWNLLIKNWNSVHSTVERTTSSSLIKKSHVVSSSINPRNKSSSIIIKADKTQRNVSTIIIFEYFYSRKGNPFEAKNSFLSICFENCGIIKKNQLSCVQLNVNDGRGRALHGKAITDEAIDLIMQFKLFS